MIRRTLPVFHISTFCAKLQKYFNLIIFFLPDVSELAANCFFFKFKHEIAFLGNKSNNKTTPCFNNTNNSNVYEYFKIISNYYIIKYYKNVILYNLKKN